MKFLTLIFATLVLSTVSSATDLNASKIMKNGCLDPITDPMKPSCGSGGMGGSEGGGASVSGGWKKNDPVFNPGRGDKNNSPILKDLKSKN